MRATAHWAVALVGLWGCASLGSPTGDFGFGLGESAHKEGPGALAVRWSRVLTPAKRGAYTPVETAVPAIDPEGRKLYVPSVGGSLFAFRDDGTEIYELRLGTPMESEPVLDVARDEIYFGTERSQLVSLTASVGEIRFRAESSGAVRRRPALTDDAVFVVTESDAVEAFSRADGAVLWRYEREQGEGFLVAGHAGLTLEGNNLYTAFNDGAVVCLDAVDGTVRWIQETARDAPLVDPGLPKYLDVDTTPLLHEGVIYAASFAAGLYALDAGNGSVIWRMPDWTGIVGISPAPGGLIVASADRGVARIDGASQRVRWSLPDLRGTAGPPTTLDGSVLFGESQGSFISVDLETGKETSRLVGDHGYEARPAVEAGYGYLVSNGGDLLALWLDP